MKKLYKASKYGEATSAEDFVQTISNPITIEQVEKKHRKMITKKLKELNAIDPGYKIYGNPHGIWTLMNLEDN